MQQMTKAASGGANLHCQNPDEALIDTIAPDRIVVAPVDLFMVLMATGYAFA